MTARKSTPRKPATKKPAKSKATPSSASKATRVVLLSSTLAYRGPLFDIYTDYIREPGGADSRRDVLRHSGSVVILAIDDTKSKKDPLVLLERQYRHAAGQYMWELPAGKKEPNESPLPGAKRELMEETGYRARRWTKLLRFYPSPGFLGEWMQIYLAEGLTLGETQPDEDEYIECHMVPLSQVLLWVESNKIIDGKSIIALLHYDRLRRTRS
ncbi:MAG TPA: NUDIX hydrolase [Acidobacteriaceae bacterium]|jgi:ADP-ribose pyrophosphatase|nr:NUDIX hydrolase [Acidobacteriaceae bacterium]